MTDVSDRHLVGAIPQDQGDDFERRPAELTGVRLRLVIGLGAVLLFFVLYTAANIPLHPTLQRSIFLLALIILAVVLHPMPRKARAWDVAIVVGGMLSVGYLLFNWKEMAYRATFDPQTSEYILGITVVVVVLDVTRRVLGWALPSVALACLAYAYFGNHFPEPFTHRGYSISRLLATQYFTHEGLFGSLLGVAVDVVSIFVLFGCLMQYVGLGDILMRIAVRVSGNSAGGPAKVAVLASALFGTVSGSSTSNVVATGTVTIPMMRRYGFSREFAGATEAVSSTGGQIMPPIMGVAAFLVADITGIPYATIVLAAVIPAILYYAALFMEVHLESRRLDLRSAKHVVTFARADLYKVVMLLPIGVMVYFLMQGYSPARAALIGIVTLVLLSAPLGRKLVESDGLGRLVRMFVNAILTVGLACAVAGIIVGALNITGTTLRLSYVVVELAGNSAALLLVGTAILTIILGCGLPTPAAYAVAASFAAPALVLAGFDKLQAHMFVFFFACLSAVTPPVAIAAYAAAALAEASPLRTSLTAFKLAIGAFIVPFMFVWNDAFFIGVGDAWPVARAIVTGLIGVSLIAVAVIGHLSRPITPVERLIYLVAAVCFLDPAWWTDVVGLCIAASLLTMNIVLIRISGRREVAR